MDYTTFRATFFDEYRAHVAQNQSQAAIDEAFKQQAFVYAVSHHGLFKIGMVDDALFRRLNEYRTILREFKVHFLAGFPKGKYAEATAHNHARNAEWFLHSELAAHRLRFPSYINGTYADQGGNESELFRSLSAAQVEAAFERMLSDYPAQKYGHTNFFRHVRRLHPVFAFKVRAGKILPVRGVVTFAQVNSRPMRRTWQDDAADTPRLRQDPSGTMKGDVSIVVRDNRRKQSISNVDIYGNRIDAPTATPKRKTRKPEATSSLIGRRVESFVLSDGKQKNTGDGLITAVNVVNGKKLYYVQWSTGEFGEYPRWQIDKMLV